MFSRKFAGIACARSPAAASSIARTASSAFAVVAPAADYARGVLTGGCSCGRVRWELDRPAATFTYCHCTRCQRRTGSAYSAQMRVEPGTLRIVSGEELVREWDPGDGGWLKCFCSNCGGQLFSRKPDGTLWSVRLGTFDEPPAGLRPKHRQFVADAATWEPVPDDGIPHHAEAAP